MRWGTICFDLDNTLYSHEKAFEKAIIFCFKTILNKKNLRYNFSVDELFTIFKKNCDLYWPDYESGSLSQQQYRRKRFLETMNYFKLPFTSIESDEFHNHYTQVVDDFSEPFPYLYSLLKKLVAVNIKIGIITNGNVTTQYNKLNKLKLNQWFTADSIFISEQLMAAKPERKIFDLAKSKLFSEFGYLFVGDSWDHDVVGAVSAGWDCIYLNTRNETPKTKDKPVHICTTLSEAAKFICQENLLKGDVSFQ